MFCVIVGSLGASKRSSGQRVSSNLEQMNEPQYSEMDLMRSGVGLRMEAEDVEDDTVGARTPINRSPAPSRSPSPAPPQTYLSKCQPSRRRHQQRAQNPDVPILAPRTPWSTTAPSEGGHSQLLSQPPRQLSLYPTASFSNRHYRHHQFQTRLLAGDDPESGKPVYVSLCLSLPS